MVTVQPGFGRASRWRAVRLWIRREARTLPWSAAAIAVSSRTMCTASLTGWSPGPGAGPARCPGPVPRQRSARSRSTPSNAARGLLRPRGTLGTLGRSQQRLGGTSEIRAQRQPLSSSYGGQPVLDFHGVRTLASDIVVLLPLPQGWGRYPYPTRHATDSSHDPVAWPNPVQCCDRGDPPSPPTEVPTLGPARVLSPGRGRAVPPVLPTGGPTAAQTPRSEMRHRTLPRWTPAARPARPAHGCRSTRRAATDAGG